MNLVRDLGGRIYWDVAFRKNKQKGRGFFLGRLGFMCLFGFLALGINANLVFLGFGTVDSDAAACADFRHFNACFVC